MSADPPEQLTVLYIAGFARSGSTLLGNLLGQVRGLSHVGELGRLWLELTRTDRKTQCGCSLDLHECPFWSAILAELEGSPGFPGIEEMRRWYEVATAGAGDPDWDALDREAFVDALVRTYRTVGLATGGDVIVDSTKQPAYGAVLSEIPELRVRTIHLLRDPRGVMASRVQKSRDVSAAKALRVMALDLFRWRQVNRASHRLARATSGLTMRYEDLTAAPGRELDRVLELVGAEADLGFIDDDGQIWLEPTHTVWGNKSRFQTGELRVSQDLRWKNELSRMEATAISLSTRALMKRYGYV
jgi:hypothetical protein